MGRLTEYFGRLNQRSTRRNDSLPDHIHPLSAPAAALCDRIRHMKVDWSGVAELEAREHMVAFPGPLKTDLDPPGCSARMKAARKATRLLMAMKAEGETPKLAKRFDAACRVIDDEDGELGQILRSGVFGDEATREPVTVPTVAELKGTTIELWAPCGQ